MFEYYEEPASTNDLLSLMYILDGNVKRVVFTSEMDPLVFPRDPTPPPRYAEVLSSFESFLDFYRNLNGEGEHSEIITYYKLKHGKLPFMSLYSKYIQLRKKDDKREGVTYYNEDLYRALLECNEYVSNRGSLDMFLAPFYMSQFFEQNGELRKSRRLRREARRIARASNRLDVIREIDGGGHRPPG
ncbi:hypothetical protein [Encephalitozoon cuniculi GB-M1]|uniref:Uncharacterized protein n=1 Tax=Encephalitozoon cuniculi (strain GB-M1) TaxID=284813 RepID=Q8SVJ7_ENCCU|nr:uncharacterized protein ECU05_0830 [Encephalitozoon cuniculi GB-M1]CAD26602.1 hypothetical protein [Encephalitozoon cuniculi GB-M1]